MMLMTVIIFFDDDDDATLSHLATLCRFTLTHVEPIAKLEVKNVWFNK